MLGNTKEKKKDDSALIFFLWVFPQQVWTFFQSLTALLHLHSPSEATAWISRLKGPCHEIIPFTSPPHTLTVDPVRNRTEAKLEILCAVYLTANPSTAKTDHSVAFQKDF